MTIGLRYAARSHVGMVRSTNQDSAYAGPHLLALADGMGGHAGGDIASSVVISALVGLDEEALGASEAGDKLLAAIHSGNDDLAVRVEENPSLAGMGTTLIAILRSQASLVLAHIGDSRAFLARDGAVTQVTKDHSYVQTLVDDGKITAEEATVHPQRSMVTRVLTGHEADEPDLVVRTAQIGDRYLIASDGLTDYVARDTVDEVLLGDRDAGATADALVDLALRAGAPDNVTVVVGDIVDDSPSTMPEVVGAAAIRRKGTRPIPLTPAAKAAALSAETTGTTALEDDDLTLAEEAPRSKRRTIVRTIATLALALLVLAGGGYAAYAWVQSQYYVGDHDGSVTIYRGINQSVGSLQLSSTVEVSDVHTDDLPGFYRQRVIDTVSRPSEESARDLVDELRVQAVACRATRAIGGTCEDGKPAAPSPSTTTPAPTTTGTPSPTTTPAPTSPTASSTVRGIA
ncbi:MAG: PP2C family protein-serine/threonine phosphatase [Nostocoides sp.]